MDKIYYLCNMIGVFTSTNVAVFDSHGKNISKFTSFQVSDTFNLNDENILEIKNFLIDKENFFVTFEKDIDYIINFIGIKSLKNDFFFVIGPLLPKDPFYENPKDAYNFKKNKPKDYEFYSNLKKVKTISPEILPPLIFNLINCEFINITDKSSTITDSINKTEKKTKKINISIEDIELTNKRYNLENLKLKYIKLGDSEKALKYHREMLPLCELNHRIPSNIFRASKNGLFIASGIIRKAVEEVGVPPTFIHDLSSKIFTMIENSTTLAEIQKIDEEIIKEYSKLCLFHNKKYDSYTPSIQKALLFMEINKEKSITLKKVADFISLNPEYLSRLFKKEVKMNFKDYVQNIKIDLAVIYLKNPNLKISEISSKLDYCTVENFSKAFKKSKGITPAKFRESLM
ncbi:MAG: helix-turn-helix domain-containing protein [Cetobacterium sp.]